MMRLISGVFFCLFYLGTLLILPTWSSDILQRNTTSPLQALRAEYYVQGGDLTLMGGIHLQIETIFDQVPFVAPCRGANSPTPPGARNGSVPLFNPVPLPLPCPCAPCED